MTLGMRSAFVATALLLAGSLPAVNAQVQTYVGCFSTSQPMKDQGEYTYQSNGYCLNLCFEAGFTAFGLTGGKNCLCGHQLPEKSTKVDDSECDTPCAAWPLVMCGGDDTFSIYLTGAEENVPYYSPSTTTTNGNSGSGSSGNSTTSTEASSATSADNTPYATAQNESTAPDSQQKKDGPNTAAIAAGVVVGVVGLFALIGAGFFLWRFKTRHPADQRLREMTMNNPERFAGGGGPDHGVHSAVVGGGVAGDGKPMSQSSMSDSRFDTDFMAQRRQSNGSIDDDQDFSRRILQVTNPDRL